MRILTTSTQVWLFLLGVSFACLILGYELGGRLGLFLGLVIAIALHAFIFVYGQSDLPQKMQTTPLRGEDAWGLNQTLKNMSSEIGLSTPKISLVDSNSPLALSIVQPWQPGHLILSTSLLQKLTPHELNMVVAHLLGHLHHMDNFHSGVISGTVRLILGIAQFLDEMWIPNYWRKQKQTPFKYLMGPLAWLVLRTTVNSKFYYQNDDLAVVLTKDRKALADALWKTQGMANARPYSLPPCASSHFFINPQGGSSTWLDTHPRVSERIRRLIGTDTI